MDLITLSPRIDVHPSHHLRSPGMVLLHDYLDPDAMSAQQLGRRSGIPAWHLRDLIAGNGRISANDAIRLAGALRTSAFYWLVLQARYDLEKEWQKRRITPPIVG